MSRRVLSVLRSYSVPGVFALILCSSVELFSQVPPGNHFKCYATEGEQVADPGVILRDQFDAAGAAGKETKVFKAIRFCNPVAKTTADGVVTPIVDPFLHMTLYLTAPTDLAPTRRVLAQNQFGQQRLYLYSPIVLAVPTKKNDEPTSNNMGHYKCYSASGRNLRRPVQLEDQFTVGDPQAARVLRPRLFCNPTEKRHGDVVVPIQNPQNHLLCYTMTTNDMTAEARISNQFENNLLPLAKPDLLCVPTAKLQVNVIE